VIDLFPRATGWVAPGFVTQDYGGSLVLGISNPGGRDRGYWVPMPWLTQAEMASFRAVVINPSFFASLARLFTHAAN
jgi:hypothetical protein